MTIHVFLNSNRKLSMKDFLSEKLVDHPHDFSHVHIAFILRACIIIVERIHAEKPETNAVGHNGFACHLLALRRRVVTAIDREVGTKILVEGDANGVVAYDNTLVEGTNLHVNGRRLHFREHLPHLGKYQGELLADVAHVGILQLSLRDNNLKRRVLIELKELCVYFRVVDFPQLKYVLNQGTRLHWVVDVHLLQRREVTSREIAALKTVIALYVDHSFAVVAILLQA